MRDVELVRRLLWGSIRRGRSVELNGQEQRVDVWAGHAEGVRWPCPEGGAELSLGDHAAERVWRHFGQLPVHDVPARPASPGAVPDAWDPASAAALLRRAPGSRPSLSGWPSTSSRKPTSGGHPDSAHELGRGLAHPHFAAQGFLAAHGFAVWAD